MSRKSKRLKDKPDIDFSEEVEGVESTAEAVEEPTIFHDDTSKILFFPLIYTAFSDERFPFNS